MLEMVKQLVNESNSMMKHALSQGMVVPKGLAEGLYKLRTKYIAVEEEKATFDSNEIEQLASIHQSLARTIEPATPNTINLLYIDSESKRFFRFLGPVPLIRQFSLLSIILLVSLLGLASSANVNIANINAGFFGSQGNVLLLNQTFLLCCAGLGAAFAGLFTANRYIAKGTYDPKYDSSYWSTLILGFMAGIIIVELLPAEFFTGENSQLASFGKPTFALIGGFAANMLYRLLKRLVDTIDHLIRGEPTAIIDAESRAQKAQLAEKKSQMQTSQAVDLIKLQNELKDETDLKNCKDKINQLVEKSIGGSNVSQAS